MSASPTSFRLAGVLIAFLSFAVVGTWPGFGAEKSSRNSLEDYLKRLRYDSLDYQRDETRGFRMKGEIGGKKVGLLVDTGWGLTALSPGSAAGLKTLAQSGVVLEDRILGKLTNSDLVLMDKLVIGQGQFLNQPAQVKKLRFEYVKVPYDGVLGCDFFVRNFCLIDCGSQHVFFRSSQPSDSESKALEETLRRSGFAEVSIEPGYGPTVETRANGKPLRLIVDTGSPFSVLDISQLKRLGLSTLKAPKTGSMISEDVNTLIVGVDKIGAHRMEISVLKTLQFGARTWKDVYVGVTELKFWGIASARTPLADQQGFLGAEQLIAHGALIDFAGEKLWFRPEKIGNKR